MQNQRGFIGIGILIAILFGLAVLGGGAYFVVHQETPSQPASKNFDNVQTLPKTNDQKQNTETKINTSTQTTPPQTSDTNNQAGATTKPVIHYFRLSSASSASKPTLEWSTANTHDFNNCNIFRYVTRYQITSDDPNKTYAIKASGSLEAQGGYFYRLVCHASNDKKDTVSQDIDLLSPIGEQITGPRVSVNLIKGTDRGFSASPIFGPAPRSVDFGGGIDGATVDFGDGMSGSFSFPSCSPGSGCSPVASHRYTKPGTYVATLVGSGAKITIKVDNPGSVQFFASPISGQVPLEVMFEFRPIEPQAYSLDFGDGTSPSECVPSYHDCGLEHLYTVSGNYKATLKSSGIVVAYATVVVGN